MTNKQNETKPTIYKHTYSIKTQDENIPLLFYTDENQLLFVYFNNKEGLASLNPRVSTYLQKSTVVSSRSSAYKKSHKIQKEISNFFNTYFKQKVTKPKNNTAINPQKYINQEVLSLFGTEFQVKVWNAILTVAYGKTTTYKVLAEHIKHPSAFRAVGSAVGKNPISILIPCHRILPHLKNKSIVIGNFGGGSHIKKALLIHEKAI